MELIRSLIETIVLTPRGRGGGLEAILHGDLARILVCAAAAATPTDSDKPLRRVVALEGLVELSVVAGTGFEPVTFRL